MAQPATATVPPYVFDFHVGSTINLALSQCDGGHKAGDTVIQNIEFRSTLAATIPKATNRIGSRFTKVVATRFREIFNDTSSAFHQIGQYAV